MKSVELDKKSTITIRLFFCLRLPIDPTLSAKESNLIDFYFPVYWVASQIRDNSKEIKVSVN